MYFLAYLIKNIHKVNIVGPMDKNVRPKRYGGPCRVKFKQNGNERSFQFKFKDYKSSLAETFQKVIKLHTSKSPIFSPLM